MAPVFEISGAQQEDGRYCLWSPGADIRLYMHLDAINGITRDLLEAPEEAPHGGGLLLGRADSEDGMAAWVSRYQRYPQNSESEPEEPEQQIVGAFLITDTLDSLIGLVPSNIGFAIGVRKAEPCPEARFFLRNAEGIFIPAGDVFPFQGSVVAPPPHTPRIVQDFSAEHQRANPERALPASEPVIHSLPEPPARVPFEPPAPRRWPFYTAAALAGAIMAVWLLSAPRSAPVATPQSSSTSVPPLGLFADPDGGDLQVYWNTGAPMLRGARSVRMFVRDGGEQSNVDLQPADLARGAWRFHPATNDVTFRMEVTGRDGRLNAESFRLERVAARPAPAAAASEKSQSGYVPPRASHRVPPVVPEGIRPRIPGRLPIDVRVTVDADGRVTGASPASRTHGSVETLLAGRAVQAAKQWRFRPATRDGHPVKANEVIHFEFSR